MKLRGLLLLPFAAFGFGCAHLIEKSSTPAASGGGSIKASGVFDSIDIPGSFTVNVTEGSAGGWTVNGSDHDLRQLQIEVKNNSLVLGTKPGDHSMGPVTVDVTVPQLRAIDLSGSADISLRNLMGERLKVDISGSGSIHSKGSEKALDINIGGSGEFDGDDLTCDDATVDISGSGQVSVKPKVTLSASISGSGSIAYSGDPKVTQSITGSGEVTKR